MQDSKKKHLFHKGLAVLFLLILFDSTNAYCQNWIYQAAEKKYKNMAYAAAIPYYEKLASNANTVNPEIMEKLADCYRRVNHSVGAAKWYNQLMQQPNPTPASLLYFAQALSQNGHYKESEKLYQKYLQGNTTDQRAVNHANLTTRLPEFYRDSSDLKIQQLPVNTAGEEFSPAYYKEGIVFASGRAQRIGPKMVFGWSQSPFLDLYFWSPSSGTPGQNEVKKLEGDVNSIYHEGPVILLTSGDSMIFTRNNYYDKKLGSDNQGVIKLKLYLATKNGDRWENVTALPFNSDEYSTGHPALSPDEKTLFFISDRTGGSGESDIWMVKIEKNTFGQPINLGEVINTNGREMFPYLDNNGNLYFASDGHAGLGGLDIFFSYFNGKNFEPPINVGYPINSNKDDFGLIVDSTSRNGYFSTFRNGDERKDDIYSFSSSTNLGKIFTLVGKVTDEETKVDLANSSVSIYDESGLLLDKTEADANGKYFFIVRPEKKYKLVVEKADYLLAEKNLTTKGVLPGQPAEENVSLRKITDYQLVGIVSDKATKIPLENTHIEIKDAATGKEILNTTTLANGRFSQLLEKMKPGSMINFKIKIEHKGYLTKNLNWAQTYTGERKIDVSETLDFTMDKVELGIDIGKLANVNPIYFDLGKYAIRPDAAAELNKIVQVMVENPGMKIELGSHTDTRGSDASNMQLSDKRAKASANYIVSRGIDKSRIKGKGYGESKLVNRCGNGITCSEGDHQLNRRTEFIVTSLGN